MARTPKSQQIAEAQSQNNNADWGKYQRKAARSFLKRAKAHGIILTINGEDKTTVVNARELNNLLRTLGIMSSQQRDYAEGKISLEELVDKLDQGFSYWIAEDDDYSTAE